jgi:hypothetical protein
MPGADDQEPVFNEHGYHFGIDFTQDAPWGPTPPFIDLASFLP